MTGMNCTLRLLREHLNYSIQEVAESAGLSFRTVLRAEQGAPLNPESRRRLCQFYGKTPEELGLVPRHRKGETAHSTTDRKIILVDIHSSFREENIS